MPDLNKLLSALKVARPLDLVLVAVALLPWLMNEWSQLAVTLRFESVAAVWFVRGSAFAIVALIIWLIYQSFLDYRIANAADRIESYLLSKGFSRVSDQRIEQQTSGTITKDLIVRVIATYPRKFMRVNSIIYQNEKRGPGIKLVQAESEMEAEG